MSGDEHEAKPWQALREIAIPPGMRGRVREGVEATVDRAAFARRRAPRARRWVLGMVAVGAVVAATAVALWSVRTPDSPAVASAPPPPPGTGTGTGTGTGAARPTPPVIGPATAAVRTVRAAAGERVEVPLTDGHVSMRGPADAVVDGAAVTLRQGRLDVLGRVDVSGPTCAAHIDGTAEVSVTGSRLVVRRFAGSVQLSQASVDCQVLELDAPPPPPARTPPPARVAPPPPLPPPPMPPPAAPDPLAAAVAAYHDAAALEAIDPATALAAWRTWLVRWPDSALAHSVELRVLGVLGRLGRHAEATERARAFLRRYPDSPRRADVLRLLGEVP